MIRKKSALMVSVGALTICIMGGCSFMQSSGTASTSTSKQQSQFIEIHVGTITEEINTSHIVYAQPYGSNGTLIFTDTSDNRNGGFINVNDSYETIANELNTDRNANQ